MITCGEVNLSDNGDEEQKTNQISEVRKILLPVLILLIWSISFGIFLLGQSVLQSSILALSTVSNLMTDAVMVILFGSLLVAFFIISDFYITLSIDPMAFVKIEQISIKYWNSREIKVFLRQLTNLSQFESENKNNPIPQNEIFILLFFGIYYLINIIGLLFITEILVFTLFSTDAVFKLEDSKVVLLPILSTSLIVGGKILSILKYKNLHEYRQMLTDTLFIFLLFGIVSALHETTLPSFVDLFPSNNRTLYQFLAIIIYLAMIPVAVEIAHWLHHLRTMNNEILTSVNSNK